MAEGDLERARASIVAALGGPRPGPLVHEDFGDIWLIGTTCEIENADKRVMGRRHLNLTDDSEKPIGEWNQYEITVQGNRYIVVLNGSEVTRFDFTPGGNAATRHDYDASRGFGFEPGHANRFSVRFAYTRWWRPAYR